MSSEEIIFAHCNDYCHTCGKKRKFNEKISKGYSGTLWITASGYDGEVSGNHSAAKWEIDRGNGSLEQSPQILVDFNIWRNGGRGDHMCGECIERALYEFREYIDRMIGPKQESEA